MRIDSVERGAVWGAAVVGIIAQSVILAVFCPLIVGVFYFSVAMLTLNLSFFLEKTLLWKLIPTTHTFSSVSRM